MTLLFQQLMAITIIFWVDHGFLLEIAQISMQDMDLEDTSISMQESGKHMVSAFLFSVPNPTAVGVPIFI